MVILIDIDNVMNNFAENLLDWHNYEAEDDNLYCFNDIDTYDWFTRTYGNKAWDPTEKQQFWNEVQVNSAMASFAFWCRRYGHEVYFVTASHYNDCLSYKISTTISRINNYHPYGMPEDEWFTVGDVIVCRDKWLINGDVLIDDCYDNCKKFADKTGRTAILVNKPWNHNDVLAMRAYNYKNSNIVEVNHRADELEVAIKLLSVEQRKNK